MGIWDSPHRGSAARGVSHFHNDGAYVLPPAASTAFSRIRKSICDKPRERVTVGRSIPKGKHQPRRKTRKSNRISCLRTINSCIVKRVI